MLILRDLRIVSKIRAVVPQHLVVAGDVPGCFDALSMLAARSWRGLERSRRRPRNINRLLFESQPGAGSVGRSLGGPSRRLSWAIPLATMLAMIGATGASAQTCSGQCADQAALLAPFNSLWNSSNPADMAVLEKNLQEEEQIYLSSSQDQKIASGTILVVPDISANLLIRAFPNNQKFYYDQAGWPAAPALPGSVANAVNDVENNSQINAIKLAFGTANVYGNAYTLLPGQTVSFGNPPPYQVSSAILDNPFTPANSSLLAYQNQQTPGVYGVNWALGSSQGGSFPSAHTMASTIDALTYAILRRDIISS